MKRILQENTDTLERNRKLRQAVKKVDNYDRNGNDDPMPESRVCNSESEEDESSELMKPKKVKKEKRKKGKQTMQHAKSMDDLTSSQREAGVHRVREGSMRKTRSVEDLLASKRRRVSEIKDIMYENAIKLRDRGGKLDDLMEKGSHLELQAEVFFERTKEIKRKAWWKLWKMRIILGILVVLVLIAVVTAVAVVVANQNSGSTQEVKSPENSVVLVYVLSTEAPG